MVFSERGPSLRELAVQALSSVERGYDLLAPKFDYTPFRTPDQVLEASAEALRAYGPFGEGLDVCCGTGAGMRVLGALCEGRVTGVDFSAGMLAQAVTFGALGHLLPGERPAVFAGVYRALRPGGVFAFPVGAPPPVASRLYWALLGFDLVMRVRNAVWRPPFVMYYRTCPLQALRRDLAAAGFRVTTVPLDALGTREDGGPRGRLVLARKPGSQD
ncbi:class I SAM-dependent methyltransferase [Actinomadura luteofluorescens]